MADCIHKQWYSLEKYDVVLADPPWNYYGDPNKDQAAGKHYSLIADDEMATLPMRRLMRKRSVLLMWATGPKLDVALRCIASWGLHYRGVAFVWVKTTLDGRVINGQGVRPSVVKPTTEFVLAASLVRVGRPMPLGSEAVGQVVLAARGRHSEKPPDVYSRIETLYPDAKRIELFARNRRAGWHAWGNEVE